MNESGPPKAPPPSTVEGACAPIGAGRAVRPREFRVSGSRRTSRNEVPHPAGAALESAPDAWAKSMIRLRPRITLAVTGLQAREIRPGMSATTALYLSGPRTGG